MQNDTIAIKGPVVVLGATGGLGEALVEALLEAGRAVVAVADDATALAVVADRFPGARLTAVTGSVADERSADALAQRLRRLPSPPTAAVVNLLKGCERGRLLEEPAGFLERKVNDDLFPQLRAARHLLPVLGESGRCARYLVVGIPYAGTPWLGYGHHSITAAAIRMLVQILRQEAADSPVRVQQLVLDAPVRTPENAECACPDWPDALAVGRHAAAVLADGDTAETFIRFSGEAA